MGAGGLGKQPITVQACPLLQVYGDKDADGFYRGETCARLGLIPCNMVSEIQADDEEMRGQLLRQGFLPLSTPVEKIGAGRPQGALTRVPDCVCERGAKAASHPENKVPPAFR